MDNKRWNKDYIEWQDSPVFTDLPSGYDYFFAKADAENPTFGESISAKGLFGNPVACIQRLEPFYILGDKASVLTLVSLDTSPDNLYRLFAACFGLLMHESTPFCIFQNTKQEGTFVLNLIE